MKFRLFSKLSFEVSKPIALIEGHCIQTDFYANYDIIPLKDRKIDHVNKIGARIAKNLLSRCKEVTDEVMNLNIFHYGLDRFLDLNDDKKNDYIWEFNAKVVKKLLNIDGIGLSKATKILHTLHPDIIPMIDNPLQGLYHKEINREWKEGEPEIFFDYYKNLKEGDNWQNLTKIFEKTSKNKLGLTKVRIFDILWWSYLRVKKLKECQFAKNVKLTSIKW